MKKLVLMVTSLFMAFATTACSAGDSSTGTESASEEAATSSYRIAMVSDTVGTDQFIVQAKEELEALAQEYGFECTNVECTDTAAWEEKSRQLCDSGYDLIVGVGWTAASPLASLADEYPSTDFAVIDTIADNDRIMSINFNTVDGSYVMGALVATAFPEETLFGYIGNYEQQSNFEYQYGFRMGVLSVNPDAEFLVNYANTYSDTSAVYNLAVQQAAAGCTFIMGSVANSANAGLYQYALEVAENGGSPIYTSGLSVDQTTEENPYIITGLTKNTGVAMKTIVDDFMEDGEVTGGATTLGVTEDAFCVVGVNMDANYRNTDIITDEVLEAGKKAAQDIADGTVELTVPNMEDFEQ